MAKDVVKQLGTELKKLDGVFQELDEGHKWESLRGWVEQQRAKLVDMLSEYLRDQQAQAAELSKEYKFEGARALLGDAWGAVPDGFRPRLPAEIRDGLPQLIEALAQCDDAYQACLDLLKRFDTEGSLGSAVSQIGDLSLPTHPDIPVDDLNALRDALKQIAEIESQLGEPQSSDHYANYIQNLHSLAEQVAPLALAVKADAELSEKWRQHVLVIAELAEEDLFNELNQAVSTLTSQPDSDPKPLLRLYWQAQAILNRSNDFSRSGRSDDFSPSSRSDDSSRSAPPKTTEVVTTAVQSTLVKAELRFTTMSAGQLDGLSKMLETLQALNVGLVRPPVGDDNQPLVALPPLPEGESWEEQAPPVDYYALENWIDVVNVLKSIQKVSEPRQFDLGQVRAIAAQAAELQQNLGRLKEEAWPKLELSKWSAESVPAQLEEEAPLHQQVAQALSHAHQESESKEPEEALAFLDQQVAESGLKERLEGFKLWLLAPQRQALAHNLDGLRTKLRVKGLDVPGRQREAEEELKGGNYSEALTLIQDVAKSQPENQELQETLEWAQAGAGFVSEAEAIIGKLPKKLRERKLDLANRDIWGVLGWHDKPFASLPFAEGLSATVGNQLFCLSESLHKKITTLHTPLRVVSDVRAQVKKAQSEKKYYIVITELNLLKRTGTKLSDEEENWLSDAQAKIKVIADARQLINREPSRFKSLRQAHTDLEGNLSPEATALRGQIGEKWAQLVEREGKEGDLEALSGRLEEGIKLLGESEHNKRLNEMLVLVGKAREVWPTLELISHGKFPDWLDTDEQYERMESLGQALEELGASTSWPLLQERTQPWHQKLVAMLTNHLRGWIAYATQLSKQRKFGDALQRLEGIWEWERVPDTFRQELQVTNEYDQWDQLAKALRLRLAADVASEELVNNLIQGKLTSSEAVEQVKKLSPPTHPDVHGGDIKLLQEDLEQIAHIESELEVELTWDNYAMRIDERDWLARQQINIKSLKNMPDLAEVLRQRVATIQKKLEGSYEFLLDHVVSEFNNLGDHLEPDSDPKVFLGLYWQVRWLDLGPTKLMAPHAARSKAHFTVRSILQEARDRFITTKNDPELDQLSNMLDTLQELNSGLARLPTKNGQPLVKLPSVPEEEPLGSGLLLDEGAIERWVSFVDKLKSLREQEAFSQPNKYDPTQVKSVASKNLELLKELQQVKDDATNYLDASVWQSGGLPAQLEQELEDHQNLAIALGQTDRRRQSKSTLQALSYYESTTVQQPIKRIEKYSLWLLEGRREILLEASNLLREDMIAKDLAREIKGIIKHDTAKADKQWQNILEQVNTKELADAVHQALNKVKRPLERSKKPRDKNNVQMLKQMERQVTDALRKKEGGLLSRWFGG